MKVLEVKAESKPSKILIGERLSNLPKYLEGRNVIILTDSNILKYYNNDLPIGIPIIEMGLGETLRLGPDEHQACHRVWPTIIRDGKCVPFRWQELAGLCGGKP